MTIGDLPKVDPKIERIHVVIKYSTSTGARHELDAATHRRGSLPRAQEKQSEPEAVIAHVLTQLGVAATIHGIPEEKLHEWISDGIGAYKKSREQQ